MYSKFYNIQSGSRIVEPLFQTGLSKHHALFLIDQYGLEWIAENHSQKGVHIIPAIEYFTSIEKIDRIEPFAGTEGQRKQLMNRARRLIGKEYNLVNYNCEHFVNEVLTGKVESKQVNNVFTGIVTFFLIRLLIKE